MRKSKLFVCCFLIANFIFHIKSGTGPVPSQYTLFAIPKLCRLNYLLTHIFVSAMVNVQRVSARTRSHECVCVENAFALMSTYTHTHTHNMSMQIEEVLIQVLTKQFLLFARIHSSFEQQKMFSIQWWPKKQPHLSAMSAFVLWEMCLTEPLNQKAFSKAEFLFRVVNLNKTEHPS